MVIQFEVYHLYYPAWTKSWVRNPWSVPLPVIYKVCVIYSISWSFTHLIDQHREYWPIKKDCGSVKTGYGFWSCSSSELIPIHLLIMNAMAILNTTLLPPPTLQYVNIKLSLQLIWVQLSFTFKQQWVNYFHMAK